MEIILLEKVRNVGKMGDKVAVKAGFARNYLIPYGKAAIANAINMAKFEARRAELEKAAAQALTAAHARKEKLENLIVVVHAKASDEGKLFGSIGTREIVKAIEQAGEAVHKNEIQLPEGVIRYVGEYPITLQLHTDVSVAIKLHVKGEQAA